MKKVKDLTRNFQLSVYMTEHSTLRMQQRMPSDFEMPSVGSFVRVLTVKDTRYDREILMLRLHGGTILGKWRRRKRQNELIIVTMYSEKTFHRMQKRERSRFIPLATNCYEVRQMVDIEAVNSAVA